MTQLYIGLRGLTSDSFREIALQELQRQGEWYALFYIP